MSWRAQDSQIFELVGVSLPAVRSVLYEVKKLPLHIKIFNCEGLILIFHTSWNHQHSSLLVLPKHKNQNCIWNIQTKFTSSYRCKTALNEVQFLVQECRTDFNRTEMYSDRTTIVTSPRHAQDELFSSITINITEYSGIPSVVNWYCIRICSSLKFVINVISLHVLKRARPPTPAPAPPAAPECLRSQCEQ